MQVKLVAVTRPLLNLTPEQFVVYAARVSNPANQMNSATAPKLLAYLVKHKHWSPFEMVDLCFEVQTSRGIAAQILRHRSFSFQEFSQRYQAVSAGTEFAEARAQHPTNRQLSEDNLADEVKVWWAEAQDDLYRRAHAVYQAALDKGVAKECARFVLPIATTTTLYMKGSLRSIIHYCQVRCTEDTQKEHREIALAVRDLTSEMFPSVAKALDWT